MVSSLVLVLCLITLPLFLWFFFQKRTSKKAPFPPGPRGLPIIGNLLQFEDINLHIQLWELSKKYGPLFSLRLGLRKAIVINSPKLAKEVMKTQDLVFCGRPQLLGQQKLSYNGLEVIFSPYGELWRQTRKIMVLHLLSSKRVSNFASIRKQEVQHMIKKVSNHASSSKVTKLNEVLMAFTNSVICSTVFGQRYEDDGEKTRFHELLNESQAMMGTTWVSDFIPFLSWIDRLRGLYGRLERNFKEMDAFFQQVIDDHMDPNRKTKEKEEEDIIDVLIQLKNQRSFPIDLTNDHIKAVFMDMLLAATDTTAATATWGMTLLLKNPRVLKKVQEELRNVGGKKEFIEEEDIQKFPYFKAMIKEILRLHLPSPLLVPRETNDRCILEGYEIPAKTFVHVNAWAIQRDPEVFKDPNEFLPERFLEKNIDIDFQGQNYELIPFGAGRRVCPGMSMGIANLHLGLSNLLYSFDWELPKGMTKEDIDTERLPGLTLHRKNPLLAVAKHHFII